LKNNSTRENKTKTSTKAGGFSVSILTAVTVPGIFLLVAISVLTSLISFNSGLRSMRQTTGYLLQEVDKRIVTHIHSFLDNPERITGTVAMVLEDGYLPADDQKALELFFLRQLKMYPEVTSIYFGNTSGGLADAGREIDGETIYMLETEDFTTGPLTKFTVDSEGKPLETVFRIDFFDTRTRPWFTAAVERDGPVWGEPYIIATGDDLSIASSRPVYDREGNLLGVVSVDLFLSHLQSFLEELELSPGAYVFIRDTEGYLVSTSLKNFTTVLPLGDGKFKRAVVEDLPVSSKKQLTAAIENEHTTGGAVSPVPALQKRDSYHIKLTILDKYPGLDWQIVTVIPESDFTGPFYENLTTSVILILISMILLIITGYSITRAFLSPLEQMGKLAGELGLAHWVRAPDSHWIREIHTLHRAFNLFSDKIKHTVESLREEVLERKKAEEEVHKLLSEKDLLLREVHHRIKNNMMMVRSLLFLQADSTANPEAQSDLEEAANRVNVILETYEMLNQSDGYETIQISPLIRGVVNSWRMESPGGGGMRIEEDIEDLLLPTNMAIHIGIIVNELLTNCKKYAVTGVEEITVSVGIHQSDEGNLEITVIDTGRGISDEVLSARSWGTGLKIVEVLVRQYNGSMEIVHSKGTTVSIKIPPQNP
jgi:two-component sensor histidine kinase